MTGELRTWGHSPLIHKSSASFDLRKDYKTRKVVSYNIQTWALSHSKE